MDVTDLDLFRDETMAYATKLMHAGVGVELHVFSGGVHAWEVGCFGARAEIEMG